MTSQPWPAKLPVQNVRIARPTDQLDEIVRFYREGQVATRLAALGHLPVEAENPYWTENGAVTVEDRIIGGSC